MQDKGESKGWSKDGHKGCWELAVRRGFSLLLRTVPALRPAVTGSAKAWQ